MTEPWWTPWPGSGPGHDLLGDLGGLTVAELGCGNGDNAAAFANGGATVSGIDRNVTKIEHARRRWRGVPRLRFKHADASAHLAALTMPVEVVCSIFGALSFNPTGPLLDSIAARLPPGGRLAIAARTPPPEPPTGPRRTAWATYAHGPGVWQDLLAGWGLDTTKAIVFDHPTDAGAAGCVILVAERRYHRRQSPMPSWQVSSTQPDGTGPTLWARGWEHGGKATGRSGTLPSTSGAARSHLRTRHAFPAASPET